MATPRHYGPVEPGAIAPVAANLTQTVGEKARWVHLNETPTIVSSERLFHVLDDSLVATTLDTALLGGADFAEVFVEDKRNSSAFLDDGKIEELTSGRDRGAGIRVVSGDTTGFAHTADLSEPGLRAAAEAAAAAARGGGGGVRKVSLERQVVTRDIDVETFPETVPKATKVDLLQRADEEARAAGDAISQVSARYGDSRRKILVANSDGLLASDDQVRTFFSINCVAMGDTGMQTGRESHGRTIGFEMFDDHDVSEMARVAAKRAMTKLHARPAPSGAKTVVVGPGGGGVLFHEACGHGLEADLVAKSASVFAGRMGEQVASPLVTLIDDGTMSAEWGNFAIDDEGRPGAEQRPDPRTASSPTTCTTRSVLARRVVRPRATAAGRATSTCRWCG